MIQYRGRAEKLPGFVSINYSVRYDVCSEVLNTQRPFIMMLHEYYPDQQMHNIRLQYICIYVCIYIYIYIYIYIHTQSVPGGMCQTSGECSLS